MVAAVSAAYSAAERAAVLLREGSESRGAKEGIQWSTKLAQQLESDLAQPYDYIIVGAGAAGCVLANRLVTEGQKRVLVLEAGGSMESFVTKVPAALSRLFCHPTYDWNLYCAEEPQLDGKQVYLARGRGLGGSTCTNATLYTRGSAADYDGWGLPGWGAKDVLPWFRAAEDNTDDTLSPIAHGKGGLMAVENPRYDSPLHEAFFEAASTQGIHYNPDFNDFERPQTGFGEFQVTQVNAVRADMASRALKPVMGRSNITVVCFATVHKVVMDTSSGTPTATGVEFGVGNRGEKGTFTAKVVPGSGEVLLAAGAIHTPQVLLLSGIGGAAELAKAGVECVVDLPGVGKNLQDQPATLVAYKLRDHTAHLSWTSELLRPDHGVSSYAVLSYIMWGAGPLATTSCDHGAFLATTGSGQPDVQLRFAPGMALDPDALQSLRQGGDLKRLKINWPAGFTLQLLGARCKSTGSVGVVSSDPYDKPRITSGYFSDPSGADLAALRRGIRAARQLAGAPALAKLVAEEVHPGPAVESDNDIEAYIKKYVCSGNALTGTCKMGLSPADGSVVSADNFKVFGTSGLRVIDSSLLPKLPGGQAGAPTVMIAERAAALLNGKISGCLSNKA